MMLTCAELVQLVTDYLDDAMPVAARRSFEEHLAICPPCRGHLGQMRETKRQLGRLKEGDLSPETRASLLEEFRKWEPTE